MAAFSARLVLGVQKVETLQVGRQNHGLRRLLPVRTSVDAVSDEAHPSPARRSCGIMKDTLVLAPAVGARA